jgi:hypothetical protein
MDRAKILQEERPSLKDAFGAPSSRGRWWVALGGTGVVVSGCEACRKRFGTNSQYLRHLSEDVLPIILKKAFEAAGVSNGK